MHLDDENLIYSVQFVIQLEWHTLLTCVHSKLQLFQQQSYAINSIQISD